MNKLFAVLLGGRAPGCHIELHDVVFVVGSSLEETYPILVNKWFGQMTKSLHVDASVELKHIDGHEIVLSDKPAKNNQGKSLYFVNFGGYKPDYFGEVHEINFYVCTSKAEAVAKAKKALCLSLHQQHCDDNLLIEELIDDINVIEKIDQYYLHLNPTVLPQSLAVQAHYRKLNLPDIVEKAEKLKEDQVAQIKA